MKGREFMLRKYSRPWLGGEPRAMVILEDNAFPQSWLTPNEATLVEVVYADGGLSKLMVDIAAIAGVCAGSFQALLDNLEWLSEQKPLVVIVRRGADLVADVGPALLHFINGWEEYTHHAVGISPMYLVIEAVSRAQVDAAHFPGGCVEWRRSFPK
jgi:hypothetical protein